MNAINQMELEEVLIQKILEKEYEGFKVTDIDSLNWAFRKMAAIQEEMKDIQNLADKERHRIDTWEQQQLTPLQNSIDFFQALATEYHQQVLAEDPKKKSISTPYGVTSARKTKEQPLKANENVMIDHIKSSGRLEYIKESVLWSEFKKTLQVVELNNKKVVLDQDGQIVEGVEVKPESISYNVKIGG